MKNAHMPINHNVELENSSRKLLLQRLSNAKIRPPDTYAKPPNMTKQCKAFNISKESLLL